jgi:hypothetical protein
MVSRLLLRCEELQAIKRAIAAIEFQLRQLESGSQAPAVEAADTVLAEGEAVEPLSVLARV